MNGYSLLVLLIALFVAGCDGVGAMDEEPDVPRVEKSNPMQIYMHYMPWYHSPEVTGYWGSHWRMANRNPNNIGEDGKREIAAHYYPLIGPYDSRDHDVIEYHLLLMKYAGVDAVLIDWYGTHSAYDYRSNLINANTLIDRIGETGLEFGIVYEEFTAGNIGPRTDESAIAAAQADVEYIEENYIPRREYLEVEDEPLLMTFGPRHFRSGSQWDEIFSAMSTEVAFLPLWSHTNLVGSNNSDGEFAWVDFTSTLNNLENFYRRSSSEDIFVGSAYPRFHDFYEEGDWGDSYGYVPSNNGTTFRRTLTKAQDHGIGHLQLVTWNDFGEGTVIEPTLEDGFLFLEILQEFTGVRYGTSELELVHRYFLAKKEHAGDAEKTEALEQVFNSLNTLDVQGAANLLADL